MTTVHETLNELLTIDFARVCAELESARLSVELKDTTAHRAAVSYCEQAVDAVLDMFLLVGRPTSPPLARNGPPPRSRRHGSRQRPEPPAPRSTRPRSAALRH